MTMSPNFKNLSPIRSLDEAKLPDDQFYLWGLELDMKELEDSITEGIGSEAS